MKYVAQLIYSAGNTLCFGFIVLSSQKIIFTSTSILNKIVYFYLSQVTLLTSQISDIRKRSEDESEQVTALEETRKKLLKVEKKII